MGSLIEEVYASVLGAEREIGGVRDGDGERAVLTKELVDLGLEKVHAYLSDQQSLHDGITGLRRLPPGSHGVWETQVVGVMLYKIVRAAAACGVGVLICEFGQKAECVRRTCVPRRAHSTAPRARRRRS